MSFQWIPFLIALAVLVIGGLSMHHRQYLTGVVDGYYRPENTHFEPMSAGDDTAQPAAVNADVLASAGKEASVAALAHPLGHSQQVVPADMLPKNIEKQWLKDSKVQPLTMPSLAAPDFRTGRDTIGQSLKYPNLQIRPDPPIGRVNPDALGPFNKSIIEHNRPDKAQLAIQ